jgi:hypothetical protein
MPTSRRAGGNDSGGRLAAREGENMDFGQIVSSEQTKRLEVLRQTMAEAQHIVNALKHDCSFAQEALERKYELLAWIAIKGYELVYQDGLWRVSGSPCLHKEATALEAVLRAWYAEWLSEPEITVWECHQTPRPCTHKNNLCR